MAEFDNLFIATIVAFVVLIISIYFVIFQPKFKKLAFAAAILCVIILLVLLVQLAKFKNWESDLFNLGQDSSTVQSNQALQDSSVPEAPINQNGKIEENQDSSMASNDVNEPNNNCAEEAHGSVRTTDELNGYIYWQDGLSNKWYVHSGDPVQTAVDDNEPLHHVYIQLTNKDYFGMAVDIGLLGTETDTHILLAESFNGEIIELYISEGSYSININRWINDDSVEQYAKKSIEIDHCGTYIL